MSFEERGAWSAILSGLITFYWFGRPIWHGTTSGTYNTPDGLSLWAWDVIWLIGGGGVLAMGIMILFNILYAIATNQSKPQFISDERDTMINKRGAVITLVIVSGGFIIAVGMLATGWTALAALNTILIGMGLGGVGSEIYRVAIYRLGL
ncbi:MAG: DUF2178 domain-containing protein [Yoonia sp.]|jgi:hypothetical protein|nr:DUF2178 domain-containing protein [Yoonia sp.]